MEMGVLMALKGNDFGQLFLVVRTIPLFQLLAGLEEATLCIYVYPPDSFVVESFLLMSVLFLRPNSVLAFSIASPIRFLLPHSF